jgi:hypothetical protein
MIRLTTTAFFLALAVAAPMYAQTAAKALYVESFRQGSTKITEESFEAKLDPQNPVYRERIKDSYGADRYVFTITPQGPQGDTKITSWKAGLTDLHHAIYSNILVAAQDESLDPSINLSWLNPGKYSQVPVKARRIIKVDSFYVALQVNAYHFTPTDSPYLDSMSVQVEFSATDPRTRPSP